MNFAETLRSDLTKARKAQPPEKTRMSIIPVLLTEIDKLVSKNELNDIGAVNAIEYIMNNNSKTMEIIGKKDDVNLIDTKIALTEENRVLEEYLKLFPSVPPKLEHDEILEFILDHKIDLEGSDNAVMGKVMGKIKKEKKRAEPLKVKAVVEELKK